MLTADAIRQAADTPPKVEVVPCPALGGEVGVRGLTCAELDDFQKANVKFDSKGRITQQPNRRGRLLALALCDERGRRLFGDDDAAMLGALPAQAVAPALDRAQVLSGINEDAVEDAEKN